MKVKTIVAATASAVAMLAAGQAFALDPWQVTGGETYTLHLGGATAQDKGIALLMRRLCTAGTMSRVDASKQVVYMCQGNGVDIANTPLVLYKNSVTGSGSGVGPVADATAIPFIKLVGNGWTTAADYTANCTIGSTAATADFVAVTNYTCGAIQQENVVPDAGISDVEPKRLGYVQTTIDTGPTLVKNELLAQAGPQVLFGVPVSLNFYRALQAAQGKAALDDEVNMPSLTEAQVTAIYTGGIAAVTLLSNTSGAKMTAPAGGGSFNICRRKNGSGTLASTQIKFTGEGCAADVKGMLTGINGDTNPPTIGTAASRITEYGGTTAVLGCLNASHTANRYAIGMASMETVPGAAYGFPNPDPVWGSDPGNWRYIKVAGYAPTLLNSVQSKYDFLYEATWNYRGANNGIDANKDGDLLDVPPLATTPPYDIPRELVGDQKSFFNVMVATNGSQAVIKELNTQFVQSFGQSGLLGKPGTPTAPSAAPVGVLTAAEVTANPINTWTRAALGSPNSCQMPYITRETGLDMLQ